MLYGAYGSTGQLILDEALRRGHRPVLAGRDGARLAALAQRTGLSARHLPLDDGVRLRTALDGVGCVLLAAGPYHVTGPTMRAASLDAGCSYLDINAELGDFTRALACDGRAHAAGVGVIPGVGYGVVFGECVANWAASRVPNATWLRLSMDTQTIGRSRAATLSVAAGLAGGGREIHDGAIRKRAIAFSSWRAPSAERAGSWFAAAPMAELVAVQCSAGVPNVVAGIPLPRAAAVFMRVAGPLVGKALPLLATRSSTPLPDPQDASLDGIRSRAWAEAGDDSGRRVAAMLETGEGYRAAAAAAVRAVELQMSEPRVGAYTPAQAFGAGFALNVPGTTIQEL
jgi:short subunit dehydrogenase-like uncharacterized protein